MVRSCAVLDAAVSTVNAVVASNIPSSSATERTAPDLIWSQVILPIACAAPAWQARRSLSLALAPRRSCAYRGRIPSDNARPFESPLASNNSR
jgi:hypothetical protein